MTKNQYKLTPSLLHLCEFIKFVTFFGGLPLYCLNNDMK